MGGYRQHHIMKAAHLTRKAMFSKPAPSFKEAEAPAFHRLPVIGR